MVLIPGVDYIGNSVVFFCHDGKENYLLNYRYNCRDENNKWDCGGEAVEFEESIEEALYRGVKIEYAVDILSFEELGCRDVFREEKGIKTHWIAHDYRVLVDRSKVKNGEPHKFDKIGWFTLDDVVSLVRESPSQFHSGFPDCLSKYSGRL